MAYLSTKPYLIRAIYDWCLDHGLTPHLAVLVDDKVVIPPGYARGGQIILDISPDATHQLSLGNDTISFQARFGGIAHSLLIPVTHVLAIYASENGQGMPFEPEFAGAGVGTLEGDAADDGSARGDSSPPSGPDDGGEPAGGRRNHLKVVK